MRRLFLMIAAAACVAAPLGDLAFAQGRGHGRGDDRGHGAERHRGPQNRGGEARRGHDRPRYENRRDDDGGRRSGEDRRRWDEDRGRAQPPRDDARRRYEERPPQSFAPPGARRGGYLPDRFRGGVVEDYRRYRLRPPPHGYSWVRVGNGFALVSEGTGQVFDVIPD